MKKMSRATRERNVHANDLKTENELKKGANGIGNLTSEGKEDYNKNDKVRCYP